MSYLALARKWRPNRFADVVGQKHVVDALSNALESGRIHHAFLFTGTRGVGKTTLARIFAKALNCEEGVSAEPCLKCNTCLSVDEGRFVDLIEVDAASRTKVDDTRELLDNVQYAPTSGRYKVYLIDEVHMLSGHSFNALLKTLEEPPEHVKFLFATTDPQKLPVTVLSRCLQFNLRALRVEQISNQLVKILNSENIQFEQTAIELIARAADGSMRDSLSLLDQAIAQGAGSIQEQIVRSMLGSIKTSHSEGLLAALFAKDADKIMQIVADMADNTIEFSAALDELLLQLYCISLAQHAPSSLESKPVNHQLIGQYAQTVGKEEIQLFYQIGLVSKRDLSLAPDARIGFEMALLRMLSFKPSGGNAKQAGQGSNNTAQTNKTISTQTAVPVEQTKSQPQQQNSQQQNSNAPNPAIENTEVKTNNIAPEQIDNGDSLHVSEQTEVSTAAMTLAGNNEWGELIEQTSISGLSKELAMNCACEKLNDTDIVLCLHPNKKHLFKDSRQQEIEQAINGFLPASIKLSISIEESDKETPAECLQRLQHNKLRETTASLSNESGVQDIMREFGAVLNESSVRSND